MRTRTAEQIRKWKQNGRQHEKQAQPFKRLARPKLCKVCRHESTLWGKRGDWCFACDVRKYKEAHRESR